MKLLRQLAAAAAASVAVCAHAQTAIQPGSIVGTFTATGFSETNTFFTVPGDRNARVTDIVLTNYSPAACYFYLVIAGSTLYLNAQPGSTILSFNSGWGMVAGAAMSGTAGAAPMCTGSPSPQEVYVTVRGFYFTVP
jgi:hypothetical protein